MKKYLKRAHHKFLRLLFYSGDTQHRLAMGAVVGLFWGMTPTVGLQFTIVTMHFACTYLLSRIWHKLKWFEFNFPLAFALTCISNPLNAPILYFIWYLIGVAFMPGLEVMSMDEFVVSLKPLLNVGNVYTWPGFMGYLDLFGGVMRDVGHNIIWPMCVGSLVTGIPASLTAYFLVTRVLQKYSRQGVNARTHPQEF